MPATTGSPDEPGGGRAAAAGPPRQADCVTDELRSANLRLDLPPAVSGAGRFHRPWTTPGPARAAAWSFWPERAEVAGSAADPAPPAVGAAGRAGMSPDRAQAQ